MGSRDSRSALIGLLKLLIMNLTLLPLNQMGVLLLTSTGAAMLLLNAFEKSHPMLVISYLMC